MFANKDFTFLEVIDNFMSSFTGLFNYLSGLTKRDFAVDIYYITSKIQERVPKEEVEDLLVNRVIPKMPDYVWDTDDFQIYTREMAYFFKEKKLDEIFSDSVIKKPRNEAEAKKFVRETLKFVFSQLLNTISEQIVLIRNERLKEQKLDYLKISRELIQTLEFAKEQLEVRSKEISRVGFSKRRIKSFMDCFANITLLLLRMYSISHQIQMKKLDLAVKQTDYLGLERTNLLIGG